MSLPPTLMRLCIKNKKNNLSLWLPIFLAYPLILAIGLVLLPLVLLVSLVAWPSGYGRPLLLSGFYFARVVWAMRGLEVDIHDRDGDFTFYLK